jgi:hypothetical protein
VTAQEATARRVVAPEYAATVAYGVLGAHGHPGRKRHGPVVGRGSRDDALSSVAVPS